ncbi:copper-binding protein, partial [Klebsiella pneumoniae]|nr:copper-binding protein [Klebsiella pneumoniae]
KKIDKEAGKITLRHGELKNLNMSAMTMVFRVKDPAMLDQVKAGDKVKFAADRVNGAVTIVQLQAAQ